jgi:hypothetical protein
MALRCPVRMNMVAWPLNSGAGDITANVYTINSEAAELSQGDSTFLGMEEYALDTDGSAGDVKTASLAGPEEYLFVPHSHAATFYCPSSEGDCHVAVLCMVDASNLNPFREALSALAPHSEHAGALLAAVSAPSFNTMQQRAPSDLSLQAYSAATLDSAEEADSGQTPPATTDRRDRRKRSGDFKDWQAQSKWNMLVTALTLPKPAAPVLTKAGRGSAVVTLRSAFVPAAGDKTKFGFRVLACPAGSEGTWPSDTDSVDASSVSSTCVEIVLLREETPVSGASAALVAELDTDALKRTGTETLQFVATLTGLQPGASYRLRAATLYDQAQSSFSDPSPPLRTAPVTAPAAVDDSQGAGAHSAGVSALRFEPAEETAFDVHADESRSRLVGDLRFLWPAGESVP